MTKPIVATVAQAAAKLRVLLLPAVLAVAGCATVPELDRAMLHAQRVPVQINAADKSQLSRAQVNTVLEGLKSRSPDTDIFDVHLKVEEALAGSPLSVGNRVTLLQDGDATYAEMLAAMRAARNHIHMEMYIFEADEVGVRFAEALLERARAGVKVRLSVDGLGSMATPKEFFRELAAGGVEVYEFNPVTAGTVLTRGSALNRRNHRKAVVIDGKVAFVGGINISSVYSSSGSGGSRSSGGGGSRGADTPFERRPWRDTQVRIVGPVVADVQRGFLKTWAEMSKTEPLDTPAYYPKTAPVGPHVVRIVDGFRPDGSNPLYATLVSAIDSSQREVRITMAYFVPHEDLLDALKRAAQRGVDVKLVLPSRTDHWMVFHAGRSYYDELLEAGVKIHERKSRLLHAKTASVDGVWSTVGSTNLDWRSLLHNDEINVVVLGPEFAAQMQAAFDGDVANSEAITREAWERRPAKDRVREISARMWARLL